MAKAVVDRKVYGVFDDAVIEWCIDVFGVAPTDPELRKLWLSLFAETPDGESPALLHLSEVADRFLSRKASIGELRRAAKAAHILE